MKIPLRFFKVESRIPSAFLDRYLLDTDPSLGTPKKVVFLFVPHLGR